MKKIIFYCLCPLRLFLQELKKMELFNWIIAEDEIEYEDYIVKNVRNCKKWSSIIFVVLIVFFPFKDLITDYTISTIKYIFNNDKYFLFIICILAFIIFSVLGVMVLKIISYYISFSLFCRIVDKPKNSQ